MELGCTQKIIECENLKSILAEQTIIEKRDVAQLIVKGEKYSIKTGNNKVGRNPKTCDILLALDSISREHAVIYADDNKNFMIVDLGSFNKTRIGNRFLKPNLLYPLENGDLIFFGNVCAIFTKINDEDMDDLPMTQALEDTENYVNIFSDVQSKDIICQQKLSHTKDDVVVKKDISIEALEKDTKISNKSQSACLNKDNSATIDHLKSRLPLNLHDAETQLILEKKDSCLRNKEDINEQPNSSDEEIFFEDIDESTETDYSQCLISNEDSLNQNRISHNIDIHDMPTQLVFKKDSSSIIESEFDKDNVQNKANLSFTNMKMESKNEHITESNIAYVENFNFRVPKYSPSVKKDNASNKRDENLNNKYECEDDILTQIVLKNPHGETPDTETKIETINKEESKVLKHQSESLFTCDSDDDLTQIVLPKTSFVSSFDKKMLPIFKELNTNQEINISRNANHLEDDIPTQIVLKKGDGSKNVSNTLISINDEKYCINEKKIELLNYKSDEDFTQIIVPSISNESVTNIKKSPLVQKNINDKFINQPHYDEKHVEIATKPFKFTPKFPVYSSNKNNVSIRKEEVKTSHEAEDDLLTQIVLKKSDESKNVSNTLISINDKKGCINENKSELLNYESDEDLTQIIVPSTSNESVTNIKKSPFVQQNINDKFINQPHCDEKYVEIATKPFKFTPKFPVYSSKKNNASIRKEEVKTSHEAEDDILTQIVLKKIDSEKHFEQKPESFNEINIKTSNNKNESECKSHKKLIEKVSPKTCFENSTVIEIMQSESKGTHSVQNKNIMNLSHDNENYYPSTQDVLLDLCPQKNSEKRESLVLKNDPNSKKLDSHKTKNTANKTINVQNKNSSKHKISDESYSAKRPRMSTRNIVQTVDLTENRQQRRNHNNDIMKKQASSSKDLNLESKIHLQHSRRQPSARNKLRISRTEKQSTLNVAFSLFSEEALSKIQSKLEECGARLVDNVKDCSVLVVKKFTPSAKILCACGLNKPIVGISWLQACADSGSILDPWKHILKDKDKESQYNFSLLQTLKCKDKVFSGYSFSSTPNVEPGPESLKAIIECSGGRWKERGPNWICISCKHDQHLWHKYRRRGATLVLRNSIFSAILWNKFDLESCKI